MLNPSDKVSDSVGTVVEDEDEVAKNETEQMTEEEFLRVFAIPLLTVLVSLFILTCCLLFVFKKITSLWFRDDED